MSRTSFQDINSTKNILGKNYLGLVCIGKEILTVTDAAAVKFAAVPKNGCIHAEFVVDAAASLASQSRAIRLWQDGSTPTASQGYILGDLDSYEITNMDNINKAQFIGIDASKSHTLHIMYFGEKV